MIQSMTGYGKSTVGYGGKKINVEVKSLNSKTLDISMRLAPAYREKEMELRQTIISKIVRGKVDFSIWVEKESDTDTMPINAALAENYYRKLKAFCERTGMPEPADWFPTLMRLPDVTAHTDADVLTDEEWVAVQQAVDEAISRLIEFRNQEGAALQKKFDEKLSNIESLLKQIETYEQQRVGKIKDRIIEGLKQIPEADYDKNRLEQELIYYIEKLDISEEKQRLSNHLVYFRATMDEDGNQGKKLGFIAQEMGREINTTGSKSNNAEMQNIVVMMKDELEQIKEQVLNVL